MSVKTTYSSKTVTWLLKTFQQLGLFNILSLEKRRKIFSVNGKGDQTVFEVVFKKGSISNKVSLKSERGQGELTALATVLHAEEMLKDHLQAGVYFSHQLHQPQNIVNSLKQHKGILIDYLV